MPEGQPKSKFSRYSAFTAELQRLLEVRRPAITWSKEVNSALNGAAGSELSRLVSVDTRRRAGAFFTGSELAAHLLKRVKLDPEKSRVFDPTVGGGDLLLAAARRLPIRHSIQDTLHFWGGILAGTDLQPEFIEATKLRLALLARQLHGDVGKLPDEWRTLLPNIVKGDGLVQSSFFKSATHVLANPPYCTMQAPAGCRWANGRTNAAAVFIEKALEQMAPGARVYAILPDVLRSGTFQEKWRQRVSDLSKIEKVEAYGIFDREADVDVFIFRASRRISESAEKHRWPSPPLIDSTIDDYFDVNVGRVVPHRDPVSGPRHPYVHARIVPVWGEMSVFSEHRQHSGLPFKPPFVVIRRTSRPGQSNRAAATIIRGKSPVFVENHLLVLTPQDGLLRTCRGLLKSLRSDVTNEFLNDRICCRHLTVGVVKAIPFELR